MSRPTRTDLGSLLQEARAMELLADEIEVPPECVQEYWSTAADLISLVADIEQLQALEPGITYEDARMFSLRHRLRDISARLGELDADASG